MRMHDIKLFALLLLWVGWAANAQDEVSPVASANIAARAKLPCDAADSADIDEVDKERSFFNHVKFECEEDWLRAEQYVAPVLKKLNEESFRSYADKKSTSYGSPPTLRVRWLRRFDYDGHNLHRLDCEYEPVALNDPPSLPQWEPKGGRFLVDFLVNNYFGSAAGRRELKLSKADCQYVHDLLEEYSPNDVEEDPPLDPEKPIVMPATSSMVESIDDVGVYHQFRRLEGYSYVVGQESELAETQLRLLMSYLADRTKEAGKKVR